MNRTAKLVIFIFSIIAIGVIISISAKHQNEKQRATVNSLATQPQAISTNNIEALDQHSTMKKQSASTDNLTTKNNHSLNVDDLIRKHLSIEMIQEINEKLRPSNKPPQVVKNERGSYIDLSDRSGSVSIAIIDDNGETIIVDITNPISLTDK